MGTSVLVRACVFMCGCGCTGACLSRVEPYLTGMQRACVILSAASLAPPYLSILSHKGTIFGKELLNIMRVFFLNFLCKFYLKQFAL